jgi:hypothetical protein
MTKTCIPCADYRIDDIDAPEFVLQPVLLEKFVVHFGSWGFHLVTERHCSKGSCRRYFPSPRNRRLLEDGQAPFLYSLIPINSRPHKSTAVLFDPTYNTSILGAVIEDHPTTSTGRGESWVSCASLRVHRHPEPHVPFSACVWVACTPEAPGKRRTVSALKIVFFVDFPFLVF